MRTALWLLAARVAEDPGHPDLVAGNPAFGEFVAAIPEIPEL